MGFLHCHACGWVQDDFWSKQGYNPFRQDIVDNWKNLLFRDQIPLDKSLIDEMKLPYKEYEEIIQLDPVKNKNGIEFAGFEMNYYVDTKKFIAYELRRLADRIENMEVKTEEEFMKIKNTWVCPVCGSKDWDTD